jgi:hypothetical protein
MYKICIVFNFLGLTVILKSLNFVFEKFTHFLKFGFQFFFPAVIPKNTSMSLLFFRHLYNINAFINIIIFAFENFIICYLYLFVNLFFWNLYNRLLIIILLYFWLNYFDFLQIRKFSLLNYLLYLIFLYFFLFYKVLHIGRLYCMFLLLINDI